MTALPGTLLLLSLAGAPATVETPDAATLLAASCGGCHATGSPATRNPATSALPALGDLPVDYLTRTLRDFRDGRRPATLMDRLMRGYSDTDIDTLARQLGQP